MKKIIAIIMIFILLTGCTTNKEDNITKTDEYELKNNLVKEDNYEKIKDILNTEGLIVFYYGKGETNKTVLDVLDELSTSYKVKVNCVEVLKLKENASNENVKVILEKLNPYLGKTTTEGILATPDFYEIKDGKILTRTLGINEKDSKEKIRSLYVKSFERMAFFQKNK